jgi:hypothetical protein
MSETVSVSSGERITFAELFNKYSMVEVPIIQRDYAQGRALEFEVRTEFLNALHTALSKSEGDPSLPLDLDFVYGNVERRQGDAFCPLDGQQRLTTLFLLHWYLAWRSEKSNDFSAFIKTGEHSRFSYTVRPSSHEFFDSLVCWCPGFPAKAALKLSDLITDQPWFFRSWKLDPTVTSALTMLDAIHARFDIADGLYDRLVNTEHPYITFQLLDLRTFGLSDDLYIKMNARGKPLTVFETFKARLERHLDTLFSGKQYNLLGKPVSTRDYFSSRIDTAWTDMFWRYRDSKTNLFDEKFMHLVKALAIVTRDPDAANVDLTLQDLRSRAVSFSFLKYHEEGCLDRPLLETLITVLDQWCGELEGIKTHLPDTIYFDERGIFEKVVGNRMELTYDELVQFHAYCAYLVRNRDGLQKGPFGEWMRVIANLATNTVYDRLEDFKRSIRSVNELLNNSDHILNYLSGTSATIQGFNEQQIREEILKAQLIGKSDEWRSLILTAEQHSYFKGQIEFLFKFSGVLDRWIERHVCDWSESEDGIFRQAFADYFAKASVVFSARGLNDFGDYRWERALLAIGNYLLTKGSNRSFLTDLDRDASWKRLIRGAIKPDDPIETKRQYVKDLLDRIDLNVGVENSLNSVIEHAIPTDEWRRLVVEKPQMISYCRNRMVRWQSPECVYLLTKVRMNGEHVDLFTYYLKVGLLSDMHDTGDLAPFGRPIYHPENTDTYEPYVSLQYHCSDGMIVVNVTNRSGGYELKVFMTNGALPAKLAADLEAKAAFHLEASGVVSRGIYRTEIKSAIEEIAHIVRDFANTATPQTTALNGNSATD